MATPPVISTPIRPRTIARYVPFDLSQLVGTMTEEEYFAFDRHTRERFQLVQGNVIQMPGSSLEHNLIEADTLRILGNVLEENGLPCDVLGSDQKVYVGYNTIYYPDIIVVCGEPQVDHLDALRNPTVLFEILSPSTEKSDRTDKFTDYQKIESLEHYVLIEQDRVFVMHYQRLDNGLWAIVGTHTDRDESLHLPLNGAEVPVPLSRIYRRVSFPDFDANG